MTKFQKGAMSSFRVKVLSLGRIKIIKIIIIIKNTIITIGLSTESGKP